MRKPDSWLAVIALALFVPLAFGQIGTSTITGRVTDSTGSVMPKVAVTVVQTETNFTFTATTNEDGLYRVPSLQVGTYRITFEAPGFKKVINDKVDLRTGDVLAVDATMQVGSVTEQIEVSAASALLETETSATGAIIEGSVLYRLPLYQRYVNSTLNLVPGMTTAGYAYGGDLGSYHLAGQRNGSIGIFEDGVNGNSQDSGTGTIKPIQNAVAEVKALTTTLPAEYGHSAGGVISVVKKSGTNELHGMASMYGRSRRMQHRLYYDKFRTSQPTATSPNGVPTYFFQPDFNLGGPIRIPKLYDGRNKTFFFVAYQRLIEKKIAQVSTTVPTAAMKGGDFSFGGIGNQIFDPQSTRQVNGAWVRDPVPGNIIPQNRIDPVARRVLGFDPWFAPNLPGSVNAAGPQSNYLADEFARVYFDDYSVRVDHQFSPAFKIYGSWTDNFQSDYGRPWNVRLSDFDGAAGRTIPFRQQNYSFGKTWVISPTMVNDARVGYFRRRSFRNEPDFNENWGQQLGIPNIAPTFMPAFSSCSNPIDCSAAERGSPASIYGLTGGTQFRQVTETRSFRDDFTIVKGTHAFKTGYEALFFALNRYESGRNSGYFQFDNMTAGLQASGAVVPNTGNTFAGFLFGSVRQAQFDTALAGWHPRSSIHSFYFQDDWKVTPTLTANLGVRYSNESPFKTKYGNITNFDPTATDDVRAGARGAFVHGSSGLNKRDNNNFQPRIGLAWHPFQKWVFRGGLAVNTVDIKFPAIGIQFEEYTALVNQEAPPGDPRPIYQLSRGPNPVNYNVRSNGTAGFVGANFGSRSAEWWDNNIRNPYVLNWNASVQYEMARNYLLEFSYQASSGVGLLERWEANTFPLNFAANDPAFRNSTVFPAQQNFRPFPHFGSVRQRSNFGHSTFHSGTVKLERRLSEGMFFSTFYTFSKALDSQDNDQDGSGLAPVQNRSLEKGRAGFDRNHRFIGTITYELPFGRGKKWLNSGTWINHIFGGFDIAWIQTIESGNPLTFSFAGSPFNYYDTFAGTRRPNLVGKRPELRDGWYDQGGDRFTKDNTNPILDINAFGYPAAFTPGNSGRGITTGTRLLWSQASASKNIYITERWRFQIRWDFQNALKTYNFNNPDTTVNFNTPKQFGKLTADPRTASLGGQPLMNLTLQLSW